MASFSDVVSSWQTFYLLTGTAAATLIGLLFVAISVGRESVEPRATRDLALFGALTFNCFFYVLVISILFLIPAQTPWGLGGPIVALIVPALVNAGLQARRARAVPNTRFGVSLSGRFLVPIICLAAISLVGVGLILGQTPAMVLLVIPLLFVIASASQNAWALLMLERQ